MGCEGEQKDCLDGYARDNLGRCQPISESDTGTGALGNTAPTAPAVALQPVSPREQGEPLVCRITTDSVDVDGDAISYTIAWTLGGAPVEADAQTELPGDTISGARLAGGEEWVCTVTPSDGELDGPSATASATGGEAARQGDGRG